MFSTMSNIKVDGVAFRLIYTRTFPSQECSYGECSVLQHGSKFVYEFTVNLRGKGKKKKLGVFIY